MLQSILIRLGLATTDKEGEASLAGYTKRMREIRRELRNIERNNEKLRELTDSFVEDGDELKQDEILSLMRNNRDGFDEVNKRASALADDMRREERREVRTSMSKGTSDAAEEFKEEWERLGSSWSSIYPHHDDFKKCSHGVVTNTMDMIEERASESVMEKETQIKVFEEKPKEYIEKFENNDAEGLYNLMDEVGLSGNNVEI